MQLHRTCKTCVLKSLPPHMQAEATARALRINVANQHPLAAQAGLPRAFIALLTGKFWGPGGVNLGVSFLDTDDAALKAKILAYANKWSKYGNIKFSESNHGEVRIATTPGEGYWSYLGTDIHSIDPSAPTMNLDSFSLATPDSEYDRVVCHEFGHTLGCPHEHAREEILDLLDKDKTYVYFWNNYGWDKDTVDQQVFTALDPASIWATRPDVTSIMCYQFSGECTKSGDAIPGGLMIDPLDGQFIGQKYPKTTRSGGHGHGHGHGHANTEPATAAATDASTPVTSPPHTPKVALQATPTQRDIILRVSDEVHKARSTHVMQGGSGQVGPAVTPPGRAYDQALTSWHPVMRAVLGFDPPKPPPTNPNLPAQVGPLDTGPITFNNGVPVGGNSQLTLFPNGGYNFNGHFHVSGAPSYNVNYVVGVASRSGNLYVFSQQGHLAGTFESGSRDFDWHLSGNNPGLAGGWADFANGFNWHWQAHVNWDIGAAIQSIKDAIAVVQQVVQVIQVVAAAATTPILPASSSAKGVIPDQALSS